VLVVVPGLVLVGNWVGPLVLLIVLVPLMETNRWKQLWEAVTQLELVHVESCFKVFASGCGDSPQDMCKPLQGTAVKGGQTSFSRSVHMVSCPSICSRTIVRESWTIRRSS